MFSKLKSFTLTDSIALQDVLRRQATLSKTLTDGITLSDVLTSVPARAIIVVLDENPSLVDKMFKSFPKTFKETVTLTDVIARQVTRIEVLLESLTLTDVTIRSVYRPLSETLTLSDVISTVPAHKIIVVVDENVALTDVITKTSSFIRSFPETIALTDVLSRYVTRLKILSEELVLSDVRIQSVLKRLSETSSLSDVVSTIPARVFIVVLDEDVSPSDVLHRTAKFFRTYYETISLADVVYRYRLVLKILSETVSLTDLLFRVPIKLLSETISVSDVLKRFPTFITYVVMDEFLSVEDKTVSKEISVRKTEEIPLLETFYLVPGKLLSESITLSEVIYKEFIKSVLDSVVGNDWLQKHILRIFEDKPKISDVVAKVSYTICGYDVRRVYFHKYLGDIILPEDHNIKNEIAKCLLDAVKRVRDKLAST